MMIKKYSYLMKARPIKVKLRKISLILIAALLLPLVQISALASATVSVNAISSIQPGGTVAISGSSTLTEVIVKVLRPNNSVVYYDIAAVTSGQFSSYFTLGTNEIAGTYKVIVGQADQVDVEEFVVVAATVTELVTEPVTGTVTEPIVGTIGTPTPTPTPTTKRPNSVEVDSSANVVKTVTGNNGRVTTTVTQDAGKLADAFKQMAALDNKTGAAPSVTITVNNEAGTGVAFNLPSSTLADAAVITPNAIVNFQSNDGGYSLPISVLDFAAIARSLGTNNENISIEVTISTVTTDINDKIKTGARGITTTQLGAAIEFTVTATGNGNTVELNNFGATYVDRTVVLAIPVDETHATVVLYDPITGEFSFVPAIFEEQADGSTKVTFKRNGNSIYTVLSSTKTFKDVTNHWAKADIELLASKLVIKGVTDLSFAPESNITRAEFAALLVRSLGLTADAGSAVFTDVKSSDWFAGAIGAAVKAKLIYGFDDNSFKPNAAITREQMAVMVSRAITAAGKTSDVTGKQNELLAKFQDNASISSWAQVAVAQSIEANIISGMTVDTFVPSANATRAQAAVMLKRFMQYTDFIN